MIMIPGKLYRTKLSVTGNCYLNGKISVIEIPLGKVLLFKNKSPYRIGECVYNEFAFLYGAKFVTICFRLKDNIEEFCEKV